MRNGEKRPTQIQILVYSLLAALAMLLSYSFLPKIIEAITPTPNWATKSPTGNPTSPVTSIPLTQHSDHLTLQTNDPDNIPTLRYFPEPIIGTIGTNVPDSFNVGKWFDNSCDIDSFERVRIYGVSISGGSPPYEITFWKQGLKFATYNLSPNNGIANFSPPAEVERGKYIQVTIVFNSESGRSEWIDDLKYSENYPCP